MGFGDTKLTTGRKVKAKSGEQAHRVPTLGISKMIQPRMARRGTDEEDRRF
jgi:hypothetical protein